MFRIETICLKICFPAFYSEVVSVFVPEVGFLYAANVRSYLHSQSFSLCLFIGELSQLILRDIKEKLLLFHVIFVAMDLVFCSCGYLLLGLLKDYFLAFS